MDRESLDKWAERGILAVVVTLLVLGPLAFGGVRPLEFAWIQGLVSLGVVLWIVRLWTADGYRLQWPPVCWFVVAFMGYAVVRYWQADVEYPARLELTRVLVYGWLFFLILNNLHRQESTQLIVAVTLTVGTAISVYALYQFFKDSNYVWGIIRPATYRGRGSGTYICPNHLAGYLEMLLPVALSMLVLSRYKALARVFFGYAAFMLLAGIGVSVSRGSYVSVGLAVLVLLAILSRYSAYRRYALAGVVVMALLAALFLANASHVQRRFRTMFAEGKAESALVRLELWEPTARMWWDHPWFGVGPAHFDLRFPAYRTVQLQTRPLWSHNDYLNLLADWGAVGGVLVLGALGCVAWGAWRTWRYVQRDSDAFTSKPSDRAALVLGTGIGLLALALHSFVDFNLQIPANAMLAVTFMAILSGQLRFTSKRYWLNPRLAGRLGITLVGLATVAWLLPQGVQRWREARFIAMSERAKTFPDQVAALLSASEVEPANAETASRIGELCRLRGWDGDRGAQELVEESVRQFARARQLNPYDTYPVMQAGMSLDWLGRHDEARGLFERAVKMDPNNHYILMLRGWHEMQVGNWKEAVKWLKESLAIKNWSNWPAERYLAVAQQKLAEQERNAKAAAPAQL